MSDTTIVNNSYCTPVEDGHTEPMTNAGRKTMDAPRVWSDEQNTVFDWFERRSSYSSGNLVVRARAGTGKTTTIVEGVNRANDGQILLAAFNKSIAKELQGRVTKKTIEA